MRRLLLPVVLSVVLATVVFVTQGEWDGGAIGPIDVEFGGAEHATSAHWSDPLSLGRAWLKQREYARAIESLEK